MSSSRNDELIRRRARKILKGIPDQKIRLWTVETVKYINSDQFGHKYLLITDSSKKKVINIGIAACWLKHKLRKRGVGEKRISKIYQEFG